MPVPAPGERRESIRQVVAPKVVAEPLRSKLEAATADALFHVIVELNLSYPGRGVSARVAVRRLLEHILGARVETALRRNVLPSPTHPYLFAELTRDETCALLAADAAAAKAAAAAAAEQTGDAGSGASDPTLRSYRAIFRIWESTELRPLTTVSIRTVKADAAQSAYTARGGNIVWGVLDSGIDASHPHFKKNDNLTLPAPLEHKSFVDAADPLADAYGHGTHVAGIIAGESQGSVTAALQSSGAQDSDGAYHLRDVTTIRGMAPECKLLSLKILGDSGVGDVTAVINALEYVMQLNGYGEHIVVHGINVSAGYLPDVRWYATGQTPICAQVDRVVRMGVNVVVAAGNTGYVVTNVLGGDGSTSVFEAGQLASINDPANAKLAISVGSTHREKPHIYGVSYFSSKGPTADGRLKPDIVAPGELIVSCAAGANAARIIGSGIAAASFGYLEDTGTSMAAPHVSGVIAAFLSVRPEYKGEAQDVRDLVLASAIDLKRDPRMQGAGLVDLMRLISSV